MISGRSRGDLAACSRFLSGLPCSLLLACLYSADADSYAAAREVEAPTSSGNNEVMSTADVATHNHPDDCWIVIDGKVYDVTKFMEDHPGGPKPLALYAGKDASEEFTMVHHPDIIKAYGELYRVDDLDAFKDLLAGATAPPTRSASSMMRAQQASRGLTRT